MTKTRIVYLKEACCLGLFTTLPLRTGHTTSFETVYTEKANLILSDDVHISKKKIAFQFFKGAGLSDTHVDGKGSYFVTSV